MNRRGTREFRVGRGKSGKKTWMIAGYPLGKLERQYYSTGKEAEAAAEKSNVMLRRFRGRRAQDGNGRPQIERDHG